MNVLRLENAKKGDVFMTPRGIKAEEVDVGV